MSSGVRYRAEPMKKRWTSEAELLDEIDRNQAAGAAKLKEAEANEQELERCKQFIAKHETSNNRVTQMKVNSARARIPTLNRDALKCRKRATTHLETKAQRLKEQLGVFRTTTMPFVSDASNPA